MVIVHFYPYTVSGLRLLSVLLTNVPPPFLAKDFYLANIGLNKLIMRQSKAKKIFLRKDMLYICAAVPQQTLSLWMVDGLVRPKKRPRDNDQHKDLLGKLMYKDCE